MVWPSPEEQLRDALSIEASKGLADYLSLYPWSFWLTVTAPGTFRYPGQAVNVGLNAVSVYPRGFVGAERHYLGGYHAHGIVFTGAEPGAADGVEGRVLADLQRRSKGFCRVEPCRNASAVVTYLAKYVTKDLEAEWVLFGKTSWGLTHRV